MMGLLKKETVKIEAWGVTGVTVRAQGTVDAGFGVVDCET